MKYGLLYAKETTNLGDDIQTFAQEQLLPHVDYMIEREQIGNFKSNNNEPVAMIANAWWMWRKWNFFPSKNIVPLLISMHITEWPPTNWGSSITDEIFSGLGKEYCNVYGPVGCRDYRTQKILDKNGIKNYFSGCLTLTLPKMKHIKSLNNKPYICLIDVDDKIIKDVKSKLNNQIDVKIFTHDLPISNRELSWEQRRKNVIDRLTIYQNSLCVITSRLHVSLPCLAMEVPVCLVKDNFDITRFDPYLDYIHNCSITDFISGFYDFKNPPKNSKKYLKLRNSLIKECNNFIDKTKNNKNPNKLIKFNYTDQDIDKWRFDLMKDALEKWFLISRDMLREYNKTIDYLRTVERENYLIKNSTSWKITKPIRSFKIFLEKLFVRKK